MTRLLALILLAILVYLLVSALVRRLSVAAGIQGRRRPGHRRPPGAGAPRGPARGEALVRCDACGLRLPESRALPAAAGRGGGVFCSEECRRRGRAGGGRAGVDRTGGDRTGDSGAGGTRDGGAAR